MPQGTIQQREPPGNPTQNQHRHVVVGQACIATSSRHMRAAGVLSFWAMAAASPILLSSEKTGAEGVKSSVLRLKSMRCCAAEQREAVDRH